MRKVKWYKCPVCDYKLKTLNGWVEHVQKVHPGHIPNHMSPTQYFNYLLTGKDGNKCVVCGKPTEWNEKSLKYFRYCNDPACKTHAAKMAKANMKKVYGKEHLLNEAEMQKKMLKGRKISGVYEFKDGGKIDYVGTYEKDFLEMMDIFFEWPSKDIEFPSPHVYKYTYEGKERMYIPDGYIGSLNLEIEIKQNTSTHHKILAVDKVKEKLKDEAMSKLKDKVNYIKIVDKDYKNFFQYLIELKESYEDPHQKNTKKEVAYDVVDEADKTNKQGLTEEKIVDFVKALQKNLSKYQYGYKLNGKDMKLTPENIQKYYKTIEPSTFQKQKCGICYDFTHFQYTALTAAMIDSLCVYTEVADKANSENIHPHTFTVIPYRNKWIYMEASFDKLLGVYMGDSIDDIVANIVNKIIEVREFKEPSCAGYYVYRPDKSFYNIDSVTFVKDKVCKTKINPLYSLNTPNLSKA